MARLLPIESLLSATWSITLLGESMQQGELIEDFTH